MDSLFDTVDKRMTDQEWKAQFNVSYVEFEGGYGMYLPPEYPEHPEWTKSYRTGEN